MRKINNDGVTLMSLVITIIVLLLLASIATYSGVNIVKQSKFTKFTTQLKMMQTQVNELYEKYSGNQSIEINGKKYTGTEIANIGKEISTLSQKNKVFNTSTSGITDSTGYKYYDKEIIKALNIDGLEEEEYFVNVAKRSVISYDGFEYNGKTYYTLEQLPDGLYNVEYSENTGKPTFDVNYECIEGGKYKITISNISYNGNIDKWQIKYQKEGQDYWSTSEDYNFVVNENGKYKIYIQNNNVISEEQRIKVGLEIGDTVTNATTISKDAVTYYGALVENYNVTYDATEGASNAWRIFYSDGTNIYLIADDYIHYDYAPYKTTTNKIYKNSTDYRLSFDNVYKDYTGSSSINSGFAGKWLSSYWKNNSESTNTNIRAVAYMLDTSIWNTRFRNSEYADYAIGGPTLEMYCASYKDTHPTKYIECEAESNTTGYKVKWNSDSTYSTAISGLATSNDCNNIYIKSDTAKAYAMWLASPSADGTGSVMNAYCNGNVGNYSYASSNPGLRPLVCLSSDIQLKKLDNGNYRIVKSTE